MNARCRAVLPAIIAATGVLLADAAAGQAPPDGWRYSEGPEICRAYRTYGTGPDSTLLQLRTFGPGSAVELAVAGPQVPVEPHSVRMVELGWGGRGFERQQFGVLGSVDGRPSVTMVTAHRNAKAFGFIDASAAISSPLDPGAESMQLRVVGNAPRELQMGPLAEPLEQLAACEARLMDKWGWGRDYTARVATPPEMRDPQSWFYKALVYPAVQDLTRVSSILELRLKVDARGKVAECVVQSSPGSSLFGSKNCANLRKLGLFDPARDSAGQPVESYFQMSVTFARFN